MRDPAFAPRRRAENSGSEPLIVLEGVCKTYRMGDTDVHALQDVSLAIRPGEFLAITGPSGSGKSTLMHILGLLDVPDAGAYRLGERNIAGLSEDELAVLRREQIGFIFQQFHLLPRVSAADNVSMPLIYSRRYTDSSSAYTLLQRVGLGERVHHRPNELSGGQQQRVAIARSLVNRPRVLLADEPTGNLDTATRDEIMSLLKELNREGITVILVTHEPEIARMAARCIRMRDGRIESDISHAGRATDHPPVAGDRVRHVATPESNSTQNLFARMAHSEWLEHIRQGTRALAGNKLRTALSVLGILIGVAAVVAMLAVGRGAKEAIEQQLSSLGSNLLVVRAGAARVGGVRQEAGATARLTLEDAAAIRQQLAGAKTVAPTVTGRAQATYGNRNWNTQVLGTEPSYARMRASEPALGRMFTEDEVQARERVAVVGMTIVRELFGGQNPIGQTLRLNRIDFVVIGVLPEKGSTGFRDQDDIVVVPVTTAMRRLLGRDYVDTIEIEAASATAMEAVMTSTKELLVSRHRVSPSRSDESFPVRNMADIQQAMQASSKTMSVLLAAIAAISLLVGGIGIMNIMLVSVTERTREIGLRKAVGARRRDILAQFLVESVVVSGIGGVAGVVFGATIAEATAVVTGWNVVLAPEAAMLAFGFSAVIGVLFGIYPARRAAALNPIEALRYE
jgi:macrolide transport system ATP-binding/permease protein